MAIPPNLPPNPFIRINAVAEDLDDLRDNFDNLTDVVVNLQQELAAEKASRQILEIRVAADTAALAALNANRQMQLLELGLFFQYLRNQLQRFSDNKLTPWNRNLMPKYERVT